MDPLHLEVNVGETANFTCRVKKLRRIYGWVFNKMYPLSWNIRKENNSIITDYVTLNNSGSYSCTSYTHHYNIFIEYFVATGTLKVYSK